MFYTISKKTLILILVLVCLFVACGVGLGNTTVASVFVGNSIRKVPIYNVDTPEKVVALTFDAAWGADKTQGIIDILNKYNAKGTFFLVGFWVDDYPDMVKLIDQNGFDIGNHSKNHLKMSKLTNADVNSEIDYVNQKVMELTGKSPKYFRAPFGDYNNQLIECLDSKNMQTIQWNVDSLDWKGISAVEILNRVVKKVVNGSIVLFHNNSDNILEALPLVLAKLQNEGYTFVTLSQLVYPENYMIDNNGVQHLKK